MNILFLDYDGVVNIPFWHLKSEKMICTFNSPTDGRVNHEQAVQWISEFCLKYDYKIVITSTWRKLNNYKECLINAGLRPGVEIIGDTPVIYDAIRGEEITVWLNEHKHVKNYIIIDDDSDMGVHIDRLIKTRSDVGFMEKDFLAAEKLHKSFLK